ncbi:phosphotransacetylase family protein [Chloroflexota bacterium]
MIELFIGSTTKYAGKTMAVLGIMDFFKNKGLKVGYFKPIGKNFTLKEDVKVEEDVLLIKERFTLEEDLTMMCPFYLDHQDYINLVLGKLGDAGDKIYSAYKQVKNGKDAVLVGGGQDLFDGFSVGVPNINFIEKLGIPVVLVDAPVFGDINLDAIIAMHDRLKDKMLGVILNQLPLESLDFTRKYFVPFLEGKGIKVWGLIPANPKLTSLSVGEIRDVFGGEIICCEDRKEEAVENYMVGAMNVEAALKHFRAQANKAVITGGDRADIQLAALETSTKVLILTGGMYPDSSVISAAQGKNVPIMVVADDTMTVVSKMDSAVRRVSVRGKRIEESITAFQKFVDKIYLDNLLKR